MPKAVLPVSAAGHLFLSLAGEGNRGRVRMALAPQYPAAGPSTVEITPS